MTSSLPVVHYSSEALPPLYSAWMYELLGGAIPPETQATCSDCAMCRPDAILNAALVPGLDPSADAVYFEPQIKCCTFIPKLANFLVGGVLSDNDPAAAAGRATLERRLDAGINVTPLGIGRHPDDEQRYERISKEGGFGRTRDLRCPHYISEGGLCGVWRHRESTCATWFCKHVRGATGLTFWRTIHRLLASVEAELAVWCVRESDLGPQVLARLLPPVGQAVPDALAAGRVDGRPNPDHWRRIWGRWAGRERDFYRSCAERVGRLKWPDVLRLCGATIHVNADITRHAFAELVSESLPQRLRFNGYRVVHETGAMTRVFTYRSFDVMDVPRPVLDVLRYFDGRPTRTVLADIAAQAGVELDPALVRKLADFSLLVSDESTAPSA